MDKRFRRFTAITNNKKANGMACRAVGTSCWPPPIELGIQRSHGSSELLHTFLRWSVTSAAHVSGLPKCYERLAKKRKGRLYMNCCTVSRGRSQCFAYLCFFSSSRGKSWPYVYPLRLLGASTASIYLHGKAASSSRLAVIKRQTCC